MKLTTVVWLSCESKGKPTHNIKKQCTVREALMTIAKWLMEVYMGSHIEIRIARTEFELNINGKKVDFDIEKDFTAFMQSIESETDEIQPESGDE